jgi:tetratricopeptide (TPR) repeat protein
VTHLSDPLQYVHKREQPPQNLPAVELTGELLFGILVAEFAEDSGDLTLANRSFQHSAAQSRDPRLAKKATQVAIFAKDFNAALASASLWVELEPASMDARQSNASLLLLLGQLETAKSHLIWLLKDDNFSAERLQAVANLMVHSPAEADVVSLFEEINPLAGESAEREANTLYATAILAHKKGHSEIALLRLERLLQLKPEHIEGTLQRARLWFIHGNKADAISSLAALLKRQPDNLSVRLNYARMLVDIGDIQKGMEQFRELVKRSPNSGDMLYGYGLLAIQNGKLDIAEAQFQNLVHLKQREAEARQALGQIFEIRQQYDEAISWYRSVPRGELFFASQLRAAQLIANRDGLQAAQTFLHQIPVEDPTEELQKLVTEAELLQSNQQFQEAFELFSIALKEAPDDPDLLYAHAMAAEKIDRIDILEQNLNRILKADPDNIQALNALGYTLADRTNRFAEAFAYIQRAYALDPDDPAILDSMGWALYRLGRHQEALDYLRKAAEHQDGEIHAHLGEVLWVSGDTAAARKVWDAALKFDPEHPTLLKTLARFPPQAEQ